MMNLTAGPRPDTMNMNNIARSGANYGVHKTQITTIPNEVMMQMDLGPERKLAKIRMLTTQPHITKNIDFNYGRDDPVKYDLFAIENKRKPERDGGATIPEIFLAETEKKSPIISAPKQNPIGQSNKQGNSYNSYESGYSTGYAKKEKPKTPYMKLVKGGKSKKLYSNEPADNVAVRVEEELSKKDYKPKFQSIRKATKAVYDLFKSAYSTALKQYGTTKPKGYGTKNNAQESSYGDIGNAIYLIKPTEKTEESELELFLKAA